MASQPTNESVTQAMADIAAAFHAIAAAGLKAAAELTDDIIDAFRAAGRDLLGVTARARSITLPHPLLAELFTTTLDRCAQAGNIASGLVLDLEAFDRATTEAAAALAAFGDAHENLYRTGR